MSITNIIDPQSPKEIHKSQHPKFYGNLTFRKPKPRDNLLAPLPKPDKNPLCAQLPSREEEDGQFRASFYEASLRRLKKQRASELKEINIPTISFGKQNSKIARAQLNERKSFKKLPKSVQLSQNQTAASNANKRHSNYLGFIEQKHEQTSKLLSQYFSQEQFIKGNQKSPATTFINSTVFAFKNLKEKYITLQLKSFDDKKLSQLLQRDHKSGLDSYSYNKSITDHVQKYKKRKTAGKKANEYEQSIFKPRLHSNNFATLSKDQPITLKYDPKLPRIDNQEIPSFIKKKELSDPSQPQMKAENVTKRMCRRYKLDAKPLQNAEIYEQYIEDFTPWETELMIFD